MSRKKIGRNDPCPCGSGKKFKKCHLDLQPPKPVQESDDLPVAARGETLIALRAPPPAHGTDDAADNPLSRATANLLQHGQRFSRMAQAALIDPDSGLLRWIGIFVLTESGRLSFFPGLSEAYDRLAASGNASGGGRFDKPFVLDHITLESDLAEWHFTQRAKRAPHERAGRTVDVGHGRVLWFGMAVSGGAVLRELRGTTLARAKSPSNDVEVAARLRTFTDAVRDQRVAHLSPPQKTPEPCFLHFAFVVGRSGAPNYDGPNVAAGGPELRLGANTPVTGNTVRLQLREDREIQILTLWLPGTTSVGINFVPPV